jgi:hypothetical protein
VNAGRVWVVAWAALPLLGAPLLAHPACRGYSILARAVLAGAAGGVLLSFVMTLCAIAGLPWSPIPLALATAALAAAMRLPLRGAAAARPDPAPPRLPERVAYVLSSAAVAVALLATISGAAGSSDLLLFWGPKAQAFARARTIDVAFLASPQASHMHPYYPPLVTNLYAAATMLAGGFSWGAATLTFPLLLAALAVALPSLLSRAERPFVPAAALVVSSLALLGAEADIAGNADMALLLFEVLGLALLLASGPIGTPDLLLSGLLFAGAATAKVEGLPFVLAVVLFFLWGRWREGEVRRATFLLLGPTLAALGAWFVFGAARNVFHTYGEYGSLLEIRWDRFGSVLAQIGRALWANGFALAYLVPLTVLLASRAGARRLPLAVAAILAAFFVLTYMLPVSDPREWIQWSAARTLAPVACLLALALAAPPVGQAPNPG